MAASAAGADAARIVAVLQSTSVTDAAIEKYDLKKRSGQEVRERRAKGSGAAAA